MILIEAIKNLVENQQTTEAITCLKVLENNDLESLEVLLNVAIDYQQNTEFTLEDFTLEENTIETAGTVDLENLTLSKVAKMILLTCLLKSTPLSTPEIAKFGRPISDNFNLYRDQRWKQNYLHGHNQMRCAIVSRSRELLQKGLLCREPNTTGRGFRYFLSETGLPVALAIAEDKGVEVSPTNQLSLTF